MLPAMTGHPRGSRLPSGPRSTLSSALVRPKRSSRPAIRSSRSMSVVPFFFVGGEVTALDPADGLAFHQLAQQFHDGQRQADQVSFDGFRLGGQAAVPCAGRRSRFAGHGCLRVAVAPS